MSDAVELEELVEDTAARCGRDLCGIEENPFLPIVTVGSLVRVLNAQPMTQGDVTSSLSGHKKTPALITEQALKQVCMTTSGCFTQRCVHGV